MQTRGIFSIITAIVFAVLISGCDSNKPKWKSPPGYDLNTPETINLSKKIDQISGLAYSAGDTSVYAIDDDNGDLYRIPLTDDPEIKRWKFGKGSDYEDLVMTGSGFYILDSKGKLVSFPNQLPVDEVKEYELAPDVKNEFEILYKDVPANRLIMICKDCAADSKKTVSAYAFDLATDSFIVDPVLVLQESEIKDMLGKKMERFKPSAANINPLTGDVYIVSSINKLLVITDNQLKVKEVYELNPELFKQPEGLCFSPAGDLLISNEAGEAGKADILIFKYHPQGK